MKYRGTGIIIQARLGSTRLPNKIILPYYKGHSIIEILINKLKENYYDIPLIIATSDSRTDDRLAEMLESKRVKVFRGSENNVLERFLNAAKAFRFENIIRICADNPFFDIKGTINLLEKHFEGLSDYTGYKVKGELPAIKSHLGLWGEIVSVRALEKVRDLTEEKVYMEHVTNYVYEHGDDFRINLIKAPEILFNREDIRLTVDTKEDFEISREIYGKLREGNGKFETKDIVAFLDKNRNFLDKMIEQIGQNRK